MYFLRLQMRRRPATSRFLAQPRHSHLKHQQCGVTNAETSAFLAGLACSPSSSDSPAGSRLQLRVSPGPGPGPSPASGGAQGEAVREGLMGNEKLEESTCSLEASAPVLSFLPVSAGGARATWETCRLGEVTALPQAPRLPWESDRKVTSLQVAPSRPTVPDRSASLLERFRSRGPGTKQHLCLGTSNFSGSPPCSPDSATSHGVHGPLRTQCLQIRTRAGLRSPSEAGSFSGPGKRGAFSHTAASSQGPGRCTSFQNARQLWGREEISFKTVHLSFSFMRHHNIFSGVRAHLLAERNVCV